LTLSATLRRIGFRCGLVAAYSGLVANVWSALFDIPGPATNPGMQPTGGPAFVFFGLFLIVVVTIMVAFGIVLYGMRGESPSESSRTAAV
jgi:hypothetical protein